MKVLLAVNPISGGVNKEPFMKFAEDLLTSYGIEYHVFRTTGNNDDRALKNAVAEFGPSRVASLGGDGTTLFTALALREFDVPVGIIPFGSANGMAKELGVDTDPKFAFRDFLMSHRYGNLDLIRVNGEHYCLHIGDVGLNAAVVSDFEKDPNRGMITYAKHFVNRLATIEPIKFKLETDSESVEDEGYMVAIANARKYGTGVVLNYHGHPGDGKFEIVNIKKKDTQSLILGGLSALDDKYSKEAASPTYHCKSAHLQFDFPQTLQLDGEVIGDFQDINMEIIEGAVQLVTSGKNPFVD